MISEPMLIAVMAAFGLYLVVDGVQKLIAQQREINRRAKERREKP